MRQQCRSMLCYICAWTQPFSRRKPINGTLSLANGRTAFGPTGMNRYEEICEIVFRNDLKLGEDGVVELQPRVVRSVFAFIMPTICLTDSTTLLDGPHRSSSHHDRRALPDSSRRLCLKLAVSRVERGRQEGFPRFQGRNITR